MMMHLKNVLDAQALASIGALLAHADWEAGRESAGAQAAALKNNEQLSPQSPAMRDIRDHVLRALDRHAPFFSATLPKRVFPPRVNRYSGPTNSFGAHVDNAIRFAPDSRARVRTDISCTLFLSPPESYEGGELLIRDSFADQRIKLPAGDAFIYPGTTLHEVTPVTRGARVACFFWIESMVRDKAQRELLFDLDNTIMRLRNAHGDDAQSVALTGTYHNLLRMWADV
jgi:PKHD-type hydroxylase